MNRTDGTLYTGTDVAKAELRGEPVEGLTQAEYVALAPLPAGQRAAYLAQLRGGNRAQRRAARR